MRTSVFVVVAASLGVGLSACGSTVEFVTEVKGSSTIEGSAFGGLLDVFPQIASFSSLDFSQTSEFQNRDVSKDDVKSLRLDKFTLQITSPVDEDFSWLESLEFYAETDGLRQRIARKENINQLGLVAPNPIFEFDLDDVDLAPSVTAPSMSITTSGTGRQPPQDTTIEAVLDVRVEAYIEGALDRI